MKSGFESGQKMLKDLETEKDELQATLLSISGAIEVIKDELGQEASEVNVN